MPRHRQNHRRHAPHRKLIPIAEQRVEIRPIARKFGPKIENLPENLLHDHDIAPDPQPAAETLLQIRRRGEVVGVRMRLQQPRHLQPGILHIGHHLIRRASKNPARGGVEVQHAVHYGGLHGVGIMHHMRRGKGGLIKKTAHIGPVAVTHQLARGIQSGVGHRITSSLIRGRKHFFFEKKKQKTFISPGC